VSGFHALAAAVPDAHLQQLLLLLPVLPGGSPVALDDNKSLLVSMLVKHHPVTLSYQHIIFSCRLGNS
jgi:hypothetical protein